MKYQDKVRASWETTESGRLALGIHDIENADFRKKNEWLRDGVMHWHLSDDVRLEISTDKLMWYLFKTLPDQARYFFKKDHKKELIIGGVIVAGVTMIVVSTKTKKPAPVPDFTKIAASTVSQWEEHGCKRMFVSAGLLKDMDKYAQYLQKCFPEALDNGVEMIIGFAPDNQLMHVKSASTELINLI